MIEVLFVLGAMLIVGVLGFVMTILTPSLLTALGLWLLLGGLVTGIPTGLWYHVVLYRSLARKNVLPANWWIKPVQLHPLLASEEFIRVKPWFVLGGFGFALSLIGGLTAMAGLIVGP